MEEGSRNLSAHKERLANMIEIGTTAKLCEEKAQEVEKFKEIHRKYVENMSAKIKKISDWTQAASPQ